MAALLNTPSYVLTAHSPNGNGERDDTVTVVVELSGGNDGLNTVVPWNSEVYYKMRPTLAVPKQRVLRLNDDVGLNSALVGLKRLWDNGALALVQGCGYPNPSRKHTSARACWRTAVLDGTESASWLRRLPAIKDRQTSEWPSLPGLLRTANARQKLPAVHEPFLEYPGAHQHYTGEEAANLQAYLREIGSLIRSGSSSRIYHVIIGGFDTHANQKTKHHRLLSHLGDAVYGFVKDLDRDGIGRNVALMIFTEFGRRLEENAGFGTDHGAAGPVFVIGRTVKGGLYGAHPSLIDLDEGDALRMTVDFRRVYATMITEWMGCGDASTTLKGDFPTLGIFS